MGGIGNLEHPNYKRQTHALVREDYLKRQKGRCAVCLTKITKGATNYALDHDWKTGANRGVLCGHCNRSLGHFCDSPELLRRAADYLEIPRIPRFPRSRSRKYGTEKQNAALRKGLRIRWANHVKLGKSERLELRRLRRLRRKDELVRKSGG